MSFLGIFGKKSQPSYEELKSKQANHTRCGAALGKWGTEIDTWGRDPKVLNNAVEACSDYMNPLEVEYFRNPGHLDEYKASGEQVREQMEELYPDEVKHDRQAFLDAWGPSLEMMKNSKSLPSSLDAAQHVPATDAARAPQRDNDEVRKMRAEAREFRQKKISMANGLIKP